MKTKWTKKKAWACSPDPFAKDPDMKALPECADEALDKTTSVLARPPEVWEQHERDGHLPKLPDCPVCVEEHGLVARHVASTLSSLAFCSCSVLFLSLRLFLSLFSLISCSQIRKHDQNVSLLLMFLFTSPPKTSWLKPLLKISVYFKRKLRSWTPF